MKTSNATATTTFDFALSSIAMAVKSAKVSMKEAQKEVDATSILPVYDAKREAATKKLVVTMNDVKKYQSQYAMVSGKLEEGDNMYDRCLVEDSEFSLQSNVLVDLITKKEEESEKEDLQTIENRSLIYGLINAINMNKTISTLAAVDIRYGTSGNDYELLVRRGMDMALEKATHKSSFLNIYHYLLGGQIGEIVKHPQTTLPFCAQELEELDVDFGQIRSGLEQNRLSRETVNFNELKIDPKSVFVNYKGATIKLGGTQATMTWKEMANRAAYLNQVVFITKDASGNYAIAKKSLNAYERLVSLYLSGVDFEGLRDNKNTLAVVVVPKGKKGLDRAHVLNIPFANEIPDTQLSNETVAVQKILKGLAREIGPVLNAEQYGKHGYVQLVDTYLKNANAFIDQDGNSHEDAAKLLARLQKLAYNQATISYWTKVFVIAGVDKADYADLADVNPAAQKMFNMALSRALVGGNLIPTLPLFSNIGTCRVVSGSNQGESGQKGMVGDALYTANPAIMNAMSVLGNTDSEEFVVAGMNSTKSTAFKRGADGWELMETNYQGKKVVFWVKASINEELKITDSATAELYEINPDNLVPLQHEAAALDTLARVVNKKKSQSVMTMIYEGRGFTEDLYTRITSLLKAGVIREKRIGNKTNSQLNAGLEFQHGVENARAILEFLIAQNKASTYRQDLINSTYLFSGKDLGDKVAEVNAEELIKSISEAVYADGRVDNLESQVWNMYAVQTLVAELQNANKPFIKFVFPTVGKGVVVPVSRRVVESVENTERPYDVRVSGLLAELLFAFGYFISRAKKVFNADLQMNDYEIEFTDHSVDFTIEKITSARDRSFGKPLSQVPTIGVNCFLITSAMLHKNELLSCRAEKARQLAQDEYQQMVTGIYTKPPVLWMGSITGVKFILDIKDATIERKHMFFDARPNFHSVMMGNAAYQSPEKAIGNGNDADGDRVSIDMIPTVLLVGCPGLHQDVYVDARKSETAAGANYYAKFWEEELSGMVRNTSKALGDFKVTAETFQSEMTGAIFAASKAKAAVAIYTTHQTVNMNNRGVFTKAVSVALQRLARDKRCVGMKSWINNVLASEFALNEVSESIWKFTLDVQGACVNFDAMDQVKDSSGRDTKKLAEVLSPSALKFNSVSLIEVEGVTTDEQKAEYAVQKLNNRVKLINDTMFDVTAHNISYDQLNTILPVDTAKESEIKFFLSYVMAFAGQEVGVTTHFYFDACQQVMKPIKSKVSNIENAMMELENKEMQQIKTDCVSRSMVKSAMSFLNKKLVKKES